MSDKERHPAATHIAFPYFFTDEPSGTPGEGITFTEEHVDILPAGPWKYDYDLAIYYGSLTGDDYIDGRCSRWDTQNYNIIIETWLKENDINTLKNNITPGAVGELYRILGRPLFYDKTWAGGNTLRFYPTPSSALSKNSNLYINRRETIGYVKNITTHPIPGPQEWIEVKLECAVSGSGDL